MDSPCCSVSEGVSVAEKLAATSSSLTGSLTSCPFMSDAYCAILDTAGIGAAEAVVDWLGEAL